MDRNKINYINNNFFDIIFQSQVDDTTQAPYWTPSVEDKQNYLHNAQYKTRKTLVDLTMNLESKRKNCSVNRSMLRLLPIPFHYF